MKRSVVVWKGNSPVVESVEVFPIAQITDVTEAIMAEPFDDPLGFFPQFEGMSKGEVMLRRLVDRATFGDKDATKELLDRLLGKPKQQVETKKLTMSYQDYLDELDRKPIDVPSTPSE